MDTREHKSTVLPIAGQVKPDKNEGQSHSSINLSGWRKETYEAAERYGTSFQPNFLKPYFPGMKPDTLQKRVRRMMKEGLFVKAPDRYGFYELPKWRDETGGTRFIKSFFKAAVLYLLHNLVFKGRIPGAFNAVEGKKNWGPPRQELNSKSVSNTRLVRLLSGLVLVEFPVTIKAWQNDTVQVSTKNSEQPLDYEGFNLFLYYLEGVFAEAFESDLTPLYVERFHFHQDRYDLKYKGGLVSLQVFKNTWLTVYTKESMPGMPVRFETGIIAKEKREIGVETVKTLLSTEQRDLQIVNLLEKFSKQPKQCLETRKATTKMYQDVWRISSTLNQKVKALEEFKQELLEEKFTLIMRGELEPLSKEIEKIKEFIKPILDLLAGEVVQSKADTRMLARQIAEIVIEGSK